MKTLHELVVDVNGNIRDKNSFSMGEKICFLQHIKVSCSFHKEGDKVVKVVDLQDETPVQSVLSLLDKQGIAVEDACISFQIDSETDEYSPALMYHTIFTKEDVVQATNIRFDKYYDYYVDKLKDAMALLSRFGIAVNTKEAEK